METASQETEVFQNLKKRILEQVDLSREVSDEEMQELIDEVVLSRGKETYLSLNEKCRLKKELFHALRKMDVLHGDHGQRHGRDFSGTGWKDDSL